VAEELISSNLANVMGLQEDRKEYLSSELGDNYLSVDPNHLFKEWLEDYRAIVKQDSTAFALSTVGDTGNPDSRIVLLKEIRDEGLVFYTNYESKKGRDIKFNKNVHALFFWKELERQVRVKGFVTKISREDSEKYFSTRPRASQLGAISSNQSQKISTREDLDIKFNSYNSERSENLKCPDNWGGYCIQIKQIEFWQGRMNRMHDRIIFEKTMSSQWKSYRVQP
jgi:pyridoxamine 5'-phosphate oxidase